MMNFKPVTLNEMIACYQYWICSLKISPIGKTLKKPFAFFRVNLTQNKIGKSIRWET